MPFRKRNDYNEYKRAYMREYRKKKKIGATRMGTEALQPKLPDLLGLEAPATPTQKTSNGALNLDGREPVRDIFEPILIREKIELLKTRLNHASNLITGHPSWNSIRRQFFSKCDTVMDAMGRGISDKEGQTLLERLSREVEQIETLTGVPPDFLDRLYLKGFEIQNIVDAVNDVRQRNPHAFDYFSLTSLSLLLLLRQ